MNVGGDVVRYYHMTLLSPGSYHYEERNAGRVFSYRNVAYNSVICWQVNPPGDKSWTLVSDPGDGTCNGL